MMFLISRFTLTSYIEVAKICSVVYINPFSNQFDIRRLIDGNNIFWTMFLILGLFIMLDKARKNKKWYLLALPILLLIAISEGGLYLLPIAIACFYFNNDAKKVSLVILIWSLVLLLKTLYVYYTSMSDLSPLYSHLAFSSDFLMMTSIPFILLYNGKRGGSGKKWEKNLFYVFYPLHLVIIYIIRWIFNIF